MKKETHDSKDDVFDSELIEQRMHNIDIESEMKKSFLDYSMSVIVSRALPDVRDGLKPVHRRILYTLHENGLTPDKAYRKCADTVGSVLGRYHPHGDASVYDAMVRLAQDFSMRYPLVDGHGNFGSVDGDPPAAYRYTESRMSRMSLSLLTDIEKDTVDFMPNYDDRLKEPVVLPSRFPNLLCNGSTGIAVGMATNIPPHNLGEVIDAACMLIDNPDASLEEIMQHIKGPDFPTGGIIMGRAGIRAAYATGRGKITLRSRCEVEEMPNGRERIVVTEIPYMVNKARLIESIADLVKEKRVEQISDLRDESDRDGMRIVIELKRDANAQVVLNRLYSYTQLQDTVGVIMLALSGGVPKVMPVKEILTHYIDFQGEVVIRRTKYDLRKAKEREHILEGLKLVCDNTDEVISIIRHSKDVPDAKQNLIERFAITDIQASAIVAMRMGQLSGMERIKIEEELAAILERVAEYEAILGDYGRVMSIVKEELGEIRQKYADERRTEIVAVSGEVDIEDLIPVEDCVITLTHFGYLKRQPVDAYRTQRRGGRGVSGMTRREEDFVEELFICSTHDYIMFFTSKGRCFRLKGYEIGEGSRTSRGTNIVNLLQMDTDEKVTALIKVAADEYDMDDRYLVMVTRRGVIPAVGLPQRPPHGAHRDRAGRRGRTRLGPPDRRHQRADRRDAGRHGHPLRRAGRAAPLPFGARRARDHARGGRRGRRHGAGAQKRRRHRAHRVGERARPPHRGQPVPPAEPRRQGHPQLLCRPQRPRRGGQDGGRRRRRDPHHRRRRHHPHPRAGDHRAVPLRRRRARDARGGGQPRGDAGARSQGGGRRRGGPGRGAGRSRRRGGAGGERFLRVRLSPERGQPPAFRGLFARNREVSRKIRPKRPKALYKPGYFRYNCFVW